MHYLTTPQYAEAVGEVEEKVYAFVRKGYLQPIHTGKDGAKRLTLAFRSRDVAIGRIAADMVARRIPHHAVALVCGRLNLLSSAIAVEDHASRMLLVREGKRKLSGWSLWDLTLDPSALDVIRELDARGHVARIEQVAPSPVPELL